jgi:hypothetical protein
MNHIKELILLASSQPSYGVAVVVLLKATTLSFLTSSHYANQLTGTT